jgi:hypothetical protein
VADSLKSAHSSVKRAIEWISIQLKSGTEKTLKQLINEAMLRFDLSPKDSEFLVSFYSDISEK